MFSNFAIFCSELTARSSGRKLQRFDLPPAPAEAAVLAHGFPAVTGVTEWLQIVGVIGSTTRAGNDVINITCKLGASVLLTLAAQWFALENPSPELTPLVPIPTLCTVASVILAESFGVGAFGWTLALFANGEFAALASAWLERA